MEREEPREDPAEDREEPPRVVAARIAEPALEVEAAPMVEVMLPPAELVLPVEEPLE
jgi:hypothetical protein